MEVLIVLLGGLIVWQGVEFYSHQKRLKQIPVRIHVNGSRGKSSVVRLIAGGLRSGGLKVLAKTTGTLPRIILPDGKEIPILRHRSASIYEQVRFFRYAVDFNPDVVVLECMAVQPVYQWITEHEMVKSTHAVITNIRPDHIREMGPELHQIARSLANTVPMKGKIFMGGEYGHSIVSEVAEKRKSLFENVRIPYPSDDEMRRFSYLEHKENVYLALQVCHSLGIEREIALQGMWSAPPDVGALKNLQFEFQGKEIYLLSAFAANDPESTLRICREFNSRDVDTELILLNSREDRMERSYQLIEMINRYLNPAAVFLIGRITKRMLRLARKDVPFIDASAFTPERLLKEMAERIAVRGLIFAIGNMGGGGLDFINYVHGLISEEGKESA